MKLETKRVNIAHEMKIMAYICALARNQTGEVTNMGIIYPRIF